jgi:MerR HTH family regulatory protein
MSAEPEHSPPDDGWLTTVAVAEQAGVSYRCLDLWSRQGYLQPEGGLGTGYARRWPPDEVEVARRMGRLVAAGLPLAWSAEFAREHWPAGDLAPGITVSVTGEGP